MASAPGRVNLIGEHTDHQEGFVLPLAIEQRTWIAHSPVDGRIVTAIADDLGKHTELDLDNLRPRARAWSNYLIGVAGAMQATSMPTRAWQGAIASDVPRGAALSSSAALEIAVGLALLGSPHWDPTEMALIGQRAENDWVGVSSGIMDQLVSAAAVDGSALFIDCRSLATSAVGLAHGTTVVVMDTSTRRGLVGSEYNNRKEACERVATRFGFEVLRDVTWDQLEQRKQDLNQSDFRRARHVVSENARVKRAVSASHDPELLGQLMNESHHSLAEDFEVSTAELDTMAELARTTAGCFGARMTGGGFGGAAVALVSGEYVDEFIATVSAGYEAATGLSPSLFATAPAAGAKWEVLRP